MVHLHLSPHSQDRLAYVLISTIIFLVFVAIIAVIMLQP